MIGIVEFASKYCVERGIKYVPVYSAKRFAAICGDKPAEQITQADLEAYSAAVHELAEATKRGTIRDVIVLCRAAGNMGLRQCMKAVPPKPAPVPLASIEAVWRFLPEWACQWMAVAYWTGLRLGDSIRMVTEADWSAEYLAIDAQKTGKRHVFPLPKWLKNLDCGERQKLKRNTDYFRHLIWDTLDSAAKVAKVKRVKPQHLRQRSINEWSRANATAGAIVHGMGLGVMTHYLDPLTVLEAAAPRVKIPACFGADEGGMKEENLLTNFRRLDPSGQQIIAMTAERLAAVG